MNYHYAVSGEDFALAGSVSAGMKKILQRLGIPPAVIKRTAVAMYEAEINMVVHAGGGEIDIDITDVVIEIVFRDHGPGIQDIDKAMEEGYSTAPELVRSLGFGAGMGLPNMKRNSDEMEIVSVPGSGTTITMRIRIPEAEAV
ncbi:MAG: ATP-binding protein [Spirochaetaceae bacterium]|jgi:anti-sigma regulatory factor (Ser/Thr protein kinase)|nr:ATP-binding protein [Spirochaetaceae bacterium]